VTDAYLLDTNIVTAMLKRDRCVVKELRAKLRANSHILISAVVYYEIKRGLFKRDAMRQLAEFEEMAKSWEWLDVNRSHWEAAAAIWARCQRAGISPNDADLLVAAQARLARAIVVTHDSDFDHLDVVREDWIVSAS
jgi:tRNA(fMet)-specific endonuclease VapC